jgi:hypothetical protein
LFLKIKFFPGGAPPRLYRPWLVRPCRQVAGDLGQPA